MSCVYLAAGSIHAQAWHPFSADVDAHFEATFTEDNPTLELEENEVLGAEFKAVGDSLNGNPVLEQTKILGLDLKDLQGTYCEQLVATIGEKMWQTEGKSSSTNELGDTLHWPSYEIMDAETLLTRRDTSYIWTYAGSRTEDVLDTIDSVRVYSIERFVNGTPPTIATMVRAPCDLLKTPWNDEWIRLRSLS